MIDELAVRAHKEGKWWVYSLDQLSSPSHGNPAVNQMPVGQSRTAARVAPEALSLAAMWTGRNEDDFEVRVSFELPENLGPKLASAQQMAVEADTRKRMVVSELRRLRISRPDIAIITGLDLNEVKKLDTY